jgi:hypothetical protein
MRRDTHLRREYLKTFQGCQGGQLPGGRREASSECGSGRSDVYDNGFDVVKAGTHSVNQDQPAIPG